MDCLPASIDFLAGSEGPLNQHVGIHNLQLGFKQKVKHLLVKNQSDKDIEDSSTQYCSFSGQPHSRKLSARSLPHFPGIQLHHPTAILVRVVAPG